MEIRNNKCYTENLFDFCSFPEKPIQLLHNQLCKLDQDISSEQIKNILSQDYLKAWETGRLRISENKISFSSSFVNSDGSHVDITLKRSDEINAAKPFFLYFLTLYDITSAPTEPFRCLENFAFLGNLSTFLEDIKKQARNELWDFKGTKKVNSILLQYIHYTFYRAYKQNKIAYAIDKSLAVFNSGLVNDRYEDIYICFTPNGQPGSSPWKYLGVCTSASGVLGKQMVSKLRYPPERVSYFEKGVDIILDTSQEIMLDYKHIIIDNISRFPTSYLKAKLPLFTGATTIYNSVTDEIDYSKLKNYLLHDSISFIDIKSDISCAMHLALTLIKNDYKQAVPIFYPREEIMSLLIPLYLTHKETPDMALVVSKTESGNYQGQTVLTMDQAYIDARLVSCFPGAWLSLDKVQVNN